MTDQGQLPQIDIYTDGGCKPNPGPGGWGAILIAGPHRKEISGAEPDTTNNRMELTAAISALRILKRPCCVDLYTDSQYLRRGITQWLPGWAANNWRRANGQPVENQDLWHELAAQVERHEVEWHWVRGHRGNPLNERADELATQARRRLAPGGATVERRIPPERRLSQTGLPNVELFVRGCALGVPGPGGYAAIIVQDDEAKDVVAGAWPMTTNNVMELWAVIAGLRALDQPSSVIVHTASKYVLDGATKWLTRWEREGWRTRSGDPVKNQEIWQELSHVMGDHDITWQFRPADKRGKHSQEAARVARAHAKELKTRQS